MKQGEKSLFKITDDELNNLEEVFVDPNEVIENVDSTVEVGNNRCVAPEGRATMYEIRIEKIERIETGLRYKAEGNALFRGNRVSAALKKYEKALEWVDCDFSDEVLSVAKRTLTVSANNN